jgi:hypothetical protein
MRCTREAGRKPRNTSLTAGQGIDIEVIPMQDLNIEIKLETVRCRDEGDGPGNAEPYLWTVFFKADGETLVVNSDGPNPVFVQGPPIVAGTPGSHGNLGTGSVDAGDVVAIPAIIGEYRTVMKPIPLTTPVLTVTEVGGMVGCLVVLMEQDNTSGEDMARGHEALDRAVRDRLAALLGTLSLSNPEPGEEDIQAISDQVGAAVKEAVGSGVSVFEWLVGFGNMDDEIGNESFRFSHRMLEQSGGTPIPFSRRWRSEGDWEIAGHIRATVIPRRDSGCCERLRRELEALEKAHAEHAARLARLERASPGLREGASGKPAARKPGPLRRAG